MPKLRFPEDSMDTTEREHWPALKSLYPAYKAFWENFVGVRNVGFLLPYGLREGGKVLGRSTREYRTYMKICMCHYSIFCDIVIAQQELDDVREPARQRKSLEHWRHFEHFYIRLRSIEDRFSRMWNSGQKLFRENMPHFPRFDKYVKCNQNDQVIQQYNDWSEEVGAIANNILHFGRLASWVGKKGFRVPRNVAKLKGEKKKCEMKDILWYSYEGLSQNDLVQTVSKMEDEFKAIFRWLNSLEERLQTFLEQAMGESTIKVDYEGALPPIIGSANDNQASGASIYADVFDGGCQTGREVGVGDDIAEIEKENNWPDDDDEEPRGGEASI